MASGKVLVVGATGGVGSSILEQLLVLPNPPEIRVSTRDPSKVTFPSEVEVVQGDLLDPSSYPRLFQGIERAFLYAQTSHSLEQLFSAAKDAGVRYIVLLSSYTVQTNPDFEIGAAHKKVEDAIVASGLSFTFIRAAPFSSNIRTQWLPMMKKTGKVILTYPNAHFASVTEYDIAAVAVVALTTDRLLNHIEMLTGPDSITQQERLSTVNRVREREGKYPVEMVMLPPQIWKTKVSEAGVPGWLADQLIEWFKAADGKPATIYSSSKFSEKPSQTFEEWVELHKDEFLGF